MKKNNSFLDRLFMALVFVFLYAPIALLIIFSFSVLKKNPACRILRLRRVASAT